MKLRRAHWLALAGCSAWAAFGFAYLGVEDGSSGLSALGWLHAGFFLPALLVWGGHSNADLPWMGALAWLFWCGCALLVVQGVGALRPRVAPRAQA